MGHFAVWLDGEGGSLLAVDSLTLQQYLAHRIDLGFKASSTARMLSVLRRFFSTCTGSNCATTTPAR
ncbi:site-specific integrase [Oceanimonas sp. NS1]|nr:site-specific integrase [Oceanimonas sp. NS1]